MPETTQRQLGGPTSPTATRSRALPLFTGLIVIAATLHQMINNTQFLNYITTTVTISPVVESTPGVRSSAVAVQHDTEQLIVISSNATHDNQNPIVTNTNAPTKKATPSPSTAITNSPTKITTFTAATSTDIHIVSLTTSSDFLVLFNNSAIASWARFIQNVKSITFIGRVDDEALFRENMALHYPQFPTDHVNTHGANVNASNANVTVVNKALPTVRWVNETHWIQKYMKPYQDKKQMPCPYWKACQQLIKLHVFELVTDLGLGYLGENVLIVDSDTVWSRNITFVAPNGTITYLGVDNGPCSGMDPIKFTEAITAGPSPTNSSQQAETTQTPYLQCKQTPDTGHGLRVGHHHILFQRSVLDELHSVIRKAWNATSLWEAVNNCYKHPYCASRVAEYLLYYAYVEHKYPERVNLIPVKPGVDVMDSGVCDVEDMKCCEKKGVYLKGCHDHRVKQFVDSGGVTKGHMCCNGVD